MSENIKFNEMHGKYKMGIRQRNSTPAARPSILKKLDKIQNTAIRLATKAFRTSPTVAIQS